MSTPKYTYSFFRIKKDSTTIASSAKKYKQLRLLALSISPSSFSSTYELESALTDSEWTTRLAASGSETFICAATPLKEEEGSSNNGPAASEENGCIWVGQVTLRGPLRREEFILPDESGQKSPPADHGDRGLWQMLSLFTLPEHRAQGLGKKLCQEALDYLFSFYREYPRREFWVRLMVKPENYATVRLYRSLGFEECGRCTLAEALIANGDKDLLPDDISGEKYSARSGLIMIFTATY